MNDGKMTMLLFTWLVAVLVTVLRPVFYRVRTRHWVPLTGDTAWMLDRGYRCELPPSPWPVVGGASLATAIIWML